MCFVSYLTETVLVVAKRQKARLTYFSHDHDLDRHPGFRNTHGMCHQRYHRRGLRTVGPLRPLHGHNGSFHHLPSAAVADDFLLFSHCPFSAYQGI